MSRQLRERALLAPSADIGLAASCDMIGVWMAVMETGHRESAVSLVCVADGATSLYFSSGGGMIGAGEHATVREAARRFIALTNASVDQFTVALSQPLAAFERVRFYARAGDRLLTAEDSAAALESRSHPLFPLFFAGHAVITVVRETGAVK